MTIINNPWIKLKEHIDGEDYELIAQLENLCIEKDKTALKLELDYKLGASNGKKGNIQDLNEFMYFNEQDLIGYIGVSSFGGPWEVNGMVHPEYRGQGIFKKLSELVLAEGKRRNSGSMLLLSDRKSESGQDFIAGTGAKYAHSEYEMYLNQNVQQPMDSSGINLRNATNADAQEIARQNAIYFGEGEPENIELEDLILPEEEEKRGMPCYLAEKDQQIIGKVNLQITSKLGAIFGLGVLPEYRRLGYGRAILLMAIGKLREAGANEIMLQVAAENANALNLYKSCGFETTSTMDYYSLSK